jgi:hypothetical protein
MKEFWWKLPILRGLSPMSRGVFVACSAELLVTAFVYLAVRRQATDPPPELCSDIAQLGATFLVAYGVEMSWVLKSNIRRGAGRENWVGFVGGIGCSGFFGIALSVGLSAHSNPLGTVGQLAFGAALVSVGFLGVLVAASPFFIYDWAHWFNTEYPDE